MQARPEDANKKIEEKKRWDDSVKAKEEDLARIGLDEKKVRHLRCCTPMPHPHLLHALALQYHRANLRRRSAGMTQ